MGTEPTVDGVPIKDIIKLEEWAYCRAEATSESELKARKSYTCFVMFQQDGVEEIDVMATDESDARIICGLAQRLHYEPGGQIVEVRENIPGITYF
jgi:hypothetical protein